MRRAKIDVSPLFLAIACLAAGPAAAEVFVDFGVAATHVESRIASASGPVDDNSREKGLHLGIGARRPINDNSDIGIRLELDDVGPDRLLALRAFDYRRHRSDRLAFNYFMGAARLSRATPAYGMYLGFGAQFSEFFAGLDLGLDIRYGDKIARDNLLPSDPQGGSPDNFFDVTGITIYLSHRF
jgi:hypothetical protein